MRERFELAPDKCFASSQPGVGLRQFSRRQVGKGTAETKPSLRDNGLMRGLTVISVLKIM